MSTASRFGRGWLALLLVAVAYTAVVAVVVVRRADSSTDFRDFWENAVRLREAGQIAADLGVHNYLPFFTIFMLPWGFLPLPVAAAAFVVLSLTLFAITVLLVENLLADGFSRQPRAALLLALGLVIPYVHSCAVLGNVGLLVLFLIVSTWFLVERGKEWPAGVALGLAVLIKVLPALLIVFFLLKRRWRVAGSAIAVTLVLGVGLPLLTIGGRETLAQHRDFYQRAIHAGSALATINDNAPPKALYSNNALPIVLRRLLSPTDGGKEDAGGPLYVNLTDWPRATILGVYVALAALFLGSSTLATVRGPRRWPPESPGEGCRLRAQYGAWCSLLLLASPLVWTHYLPLAYWPLALLADRAIRARAARGWIGHVCAAALGAWALGDCALAWPAARAAGAQIGSVAMLWAALLPLCFFRREP